MASTALLPAVNLPLRRGYGRRPTAEAVRVKRVPSSDRQIQPADQRGRRQYLLLTARTGLILSAAGWLALAGNVPLFGFRKQLQEVQQEAEVILRESEKAVEVGLAAAEKRLEATEKGIEKAEEVIETSVGFGALAQAGAVAAAELLGVLVATSLVRRILGPEAQKS